MNATYHLIRLTAVLTLLCLPVWAQAEHWTIGAYTVKSSYESSGERKLTIEKSGKEVYSETAGQFWFVTVGRGKQTGTWQEPKAMDITGDGVPDLLVEQFPLRLECCWSYSVFSLGPVFKLAAKAEGFRSPMTFEDVNGDGIYELVGDDPTFYSWYASPHVVLRYAKAQRTYEFATDLMRRPAPTEAQLAEKEKEFSKATIYAGFPVAPQVYEYMLDLIYSGNAPSAWKFLNLAWPRQHAGEKEFIAEIMEQLKKSPYWPDLEKMNRFGS